MNTWAPKLTAVGVWTRWVYRTLTFNGSFRDGCLNLHWFLDLEDARQKIEGWRKDYNGFRPHSSLGGNTPQMVYEGYLEAESLQL